MKFCRIDLSKTNYSKNTIEDWCYLPPAANHINECNIIYKKYVEHKQFDSVMPIFDSLYQDKHTDILGYYNNDQIVAFSLVKKWDNLNAESLQFAWDYANPNLEYGHKSLMVECAVYKELGYRYLYLGQYAEYKSKLDGFEILGKLNV